jgi:dihydrofolate reductase
LGGREGVVISIIAAISTNNVIGRDGDLPWRMPTDLKRFKRLTMGHHLVVGRKTWNEVGRPLPGRIMVVITRDPGFVAEGATVVHSLDEALEVARDDAEIFIAGGGEIYRQALAVADRMYLTRIHAIIEGDTRFPDFDESAWILVEREDHLADESNPYPFSFLTYQKEMESSPEKRGAVSWCGK